MGKNEVNHIAIIMDGNRRWAEENGLCTLDGHKAGAETVRKIIEACKDLGIKYLTLYAFSTENWKRPRKEVDGLMFLLRRFIKSNVKKLLSEGVRLRAIGRLDDLPSGTRKILMEAIRETEKNTGGDVILALSYGGRAEIADAAKKIAKDVEDKKVCADNIDEALFREYMYAPDIPDPEIMIRTSGELRISNFLLWQISYSELYFTEKLWPDFDKEDIVKAIESFKNRERRYGLRKC